METKKKKLYEQNIGKKTIVTSSPIAGFAAKTEAEPATITGVVGDDMAGYRYIVLLDTPLHSWSSKRVFYPPVFLCEIVSEEPDYSKATDEELNECLIEIINGMNANQILSYGEVSSFFREELNNEILDLWAEKFGN